MSISDTVNTDNLTLIHVTICLNVFAKEMSSMEHFYFYSSNPGCCMNYQCCCSPCSPYLFKSVSLASR